MLLRFDRARLTLLVGSAAFLAALCGPVQSIESGPEAVNPADGAKTLNASPSFANDMHRLAHEGWVDRGTAVFGVEGGRLRLISSWLNSPQAAEIASPYPETVAGILNEFGLVSLIDKTFQRGGRFINVRVFEFGSVEGALAGYDLLRRGSTTVLRRGDGSSEDGENISFWQDRYLFIVSGSSEDDEEAKEVMKGFADNLMLPGRNSLAPPVVLLELPVIDRVRGSEKLIMGPLSARRYFTAPALERLSIESASAAAVADYQVFSPYRERLKLLYINYGDAAKAKSAYESFVAGLNELHESEATWPGDQPRALFKINKSFLFCQLRARGRLIVISGARKAKSPGVLASQIRDSGF